MDIKDYLPLNRRILNHEFWTEKRTFSRLEAWLDLLLQARYENTEAKQMAGNQVVTWGRGELVASLRFLAERWGWTKHKAESFMKLLKAQEMVKTRTATGTVQTIITICNYDSYNYKPGDKQTVSGQYPDSSRTVSGQFPDKTNKDNKGNKETPPAGAGAGATPAATVLPVATAAGAGATATPAANCKPQTANSPSTPLERALEAFAEMRRKMNRPLTDYALASLNSKLEGLAGGDTALKIKILDQSTLNNWQDIYELKTPKQAYKQPNGSHDGPRPKGFQIPS